jgi:rare lipoprotein A
MKRLIPVLLFAVVSVSICTARDSNLRNFHQEGWTSQDIDTEQLSAKHPSLPIGSQVIVTNPGNGKQVVVTIIGRIPASGTRIIDLSRGTAVNLDIPVGSYAPVILELFENRSAPPLPAIVLPALPEPVNKPGTPPPVSGRPTNSIFPQSGAPYARWGQ